MLSFLPPFTLTPFLQLVLPLTLKMTPLSNQHLSSHGRGKARTPVPLELQPPPHHPPASPLPRDPKLDLPITFCYCVAIHVSNAENISSMLFLDVKIT